MTCLRLFTVLVLDSLFMLTRQVGFSNLAHTSSVFCIHSSKHLWQRKLHVWSLLTPAETSHSFISKNFDARHVNKINMERSVYCASHQSDQWHQKDISLGTILQHNDTHPNIRHYVFLSRLVRAWQQCQFSNLKSDRLNPFPPVSAGHIDWSIKCHKRKQPFDQICPWQSINTRPVSSARLTTVPPQTR